MEGRNAGATACVFPFEIDPDSSQQNEDLSRHLTEEITHSLARLDASAISVFAPETGRRLGAGGTASIQPDYLVSGSVDRNGDSARVLVQLSRQPSGRVLWSETMNVSVALLSSEPNRIADRIADRLRVGILPVPNLSRTLTIDAIDDYLRARVLWATGDPKSVQQAVTLLRQAVSSTSEFPDALVGLADAFNTLALVGGILPREGFDSAQAYARRAIEQDEQLASAHAALGLALYLGDWSWEEATRAIERALELQPGRAEPHAYLASIHSIHGRHDQAIVESRIATRLDPLAPMTNGDLAWYYYYAGRYDDAVEQIRRVRELDTSVPGLDLGMALAHHEAGRADAALNAVRSFVLEREGAAIVARLDSVTGAWGANHAWRWWLQRAVETTPPAAIGYLATIGAAMLGDTGAAFESVRKAAEYRVSWAPFVPVDPAFASLHGSPEFAALERQMGLVPSDQDDRPPPD